MFTSHRAIDVTDKEVSFINVNILRACNRGRIL